jgi:hypothetical protein
MMGYNTLARTASQFRNAATVVIAKAMSSAMPMQLAKDMANASPNIAKTSPPGSWKPAGCGHFRRRTGRAAHETP